MVQDLKLFGILHWLIILSAPLTAVVFSCLARRLPRADKTFRLAMGWALVGAGIPWYVYRWTVMGVKLPQGLPLELCDVTLWLAAFALFTRKQWLFELSYYWGLAGAFMAILTPSLHAPLVSYPTIIYFISHCGVVAGTLYLLGTGFRPGLRSLWRALAGLNAFAIVIGIFDAIFRTNYFFLCAKPEAKSLLDYFGKWPWYIVVTDVFALFLFALMWLPFRKRNMKATEQPAKAYPF